MAPGIRNSLFHALIVTLFFFVVDQSKFFGSQVSTSNERLVQTALSWVLPQPSDKAVPALVLISEEAVAPSALGWPLPMEALSDLIDDLYFSGASAIFIDLIIRSANHDPAGFCYLIESLEQMQPAQVDASVLALSGWDDQCLTDHNTLASLTRSLLARRGRAPLFSNRQGSWLQRPIIFGASLDYLNARTNYYRCQGSSSALASLVSCDNESAEYRRAIGDWPGLAYLDMVALLAPVSILGDGDRSARLLVDSAGHMSPAHIMSCVAQDKSDRQCAEILDDNRLKSHYLVWRKESAQGMNKSSQQYYAACRTRYENAFQWFRYYLQPSGLVELGSEDRNRCPVYPTLDLALLSAGVVGLDDINDLVKARPVIVGLDLLRFKDDVHSPLHGRLPGAYTHATSFDNIVSDNLYRPANKWAQGGERLEIMLTIFRYSVYWLLVFFVLVKLKARPRYHLKLPFPVLLMALCAMGLWLFMSIGAMALDSPSLLQRFSVALVVLVYLLMALVCIAARATLPRVHWWSRSRFRAYCFQCTEGLRILFFHLFMLVIVFAGLTLCAAAISGFFRISPPDVLSVFYYWIPVYGYLQQQEISYALRNIFIKDLMADQFGGVVFDR